MYFIHLDEKVRILISKFDADYYVLVNEWWMPKNREIQERVATNYRKGNVATMESVEKRNIEHFSTPRPLMVKGSVNQRLNP